MNGIHAAALAMESHSGSPLSFLKPRHGGYSLFFTKAATKEFIRPSRQPTTRPA
jgi:hypothetical protein